MAGQRPTLTEQREQTNHDVFFSWMLPEITGKQYIPLFVAEVPTAIEYAVIRWTAANGSGTCNLAFASNGVAGSTNTDITNTVAINGTNHTNNTFTFKTANGVTGEVPNNNIVPAGSTCFLELSTTVGTWDGVALTMRTTQKIH